jgi:hypothetical protein
MELNPIEQKQQKEEQHQSNPADSASGIDRIEIGSLIMEATGGLVCRI